MVAVSTAMLAAAVAPAISISSATAAPGPVTLDTPAEPAPGDPPVADTDTPTHTEIKAAAPTGSPESAAKSFLSSREQTYGIDEKDLTLERVDTQGQSTAVRLQQEVDGVPVLGATYVVRMKGKGSSRVVTGTSGRYFTDLAVPSSVPLPSGPAKVIARRAVTEKYRLAQAPAVTDRGLVILPFGTGVRTRHLTVVGVDRTTNSPVREQVYLAEGTGRPVLSYNDLQTFAPAAKAPGDQITTTGATFNQPDKPLNVTQTATGYDLVDRTAPMHTGSKGELATYDAKRADALEFVSFEAKGPEGLKPVGAKHIPFTAKDNRTGALDAHWGAREVYDYYRGLGRNSLDNQGGSINSVVNVTFGGEDFPNAFWNGKAMFYGTGGDGYKPFSASLDVIAHEMTHGVTEHSSNLVYFGQSGAINEAVSDYFGNAVQNKVLGISETSNRASLMGEDLCFIKSWKSCAIRDLRQVVKTSRYFGGIDDNGGVHTNSLIPAGAMWQVRQNLGADLADRVFYRAQTQYLTPLSGFTDLRVATLSAAKDLGATSAQLSSIGAAFDSRGITPGWERSMAKVDSVALRRNVGAVTDRPVMHGTNWILSMTAPNFQGNYFLRMGSTNSPTKSSVISRDATSNYLLPAISSTRAAWIRFTERGGEWRTRVEIADRKRLDRPKVVLDGPFVMITNLQVGTTTTAWMRANSAEVSLYVRRPGGKIVKIKPAEGRELSDPVISGDTVVYADNPGIADSTQAILKAYNARTGKTTVLTSFRTNRWPVTIGQPAIAGKSVYFAADRLDDSEGGAGIFRVPLAGGTPRQSLSETSQYAPGASPLTASTTRVTYAQSDFFGDYSRLYQLPLQGGTPRRVSCSTGTQFLPAAGRGTQVIWIDLSTGGPDLVMRANSRASC